MESALTNATSQTNFGTIDWVIVAVYLLLRAFATFFFKKLEKTLFPVYRFSTIEKSADF
jgi:hypothetical protein